ALSALERLRRCSRETLVTATQISATNARRGRGSAAPASVEGPQANCSFTARQVRAIANRCQPCLLWHRRSLLWIDVEPVHDDQRRTGLGIGAEGPPEDLGDGVAVVDLRERPVHCQTKAIGPQRHDDRVGYVANALVQQLVLRNVFELARPPPPASSCPLPARRPSRLRARRSPPHRSSSGRPSRSPDPSSASPPAPSGSGSGPRPRCSCPPGPPTPEPRQTSGRIRRSRPPTLHS